MYKCYITGRNSRPSEKCNKLVLKTRDKVYYGWFLNEETGEMEHRQVSKGSEIVQEVNVSEAGLKMWKQAQENLRD
jgi:hypothetical protein